MDHVADADRQIKILRIILQNISRNPFQGKFVNQSRWMICEFF